MANRGNNADVARAWAKGEECQNGRASFSTNGRQLYSYDLEIGYTGRNGVKYLRDFSGVSVTTTSHVRQARLVWFDRTPYTDGGYWSPVMVATSDDDREHWRDVAQGVADFNREMHGYPQNA
jgi:hypothetical protein